MINENLMQQIRNRFAHVDSCPFQGERVFFENAGGSLTLKSVVETNTRLAGIPDNQGRDNPASHELVRVINQARDDMRCFLGVQEGPVFIGESGTELLFRLVRAATLGAAEGGNVVGSTLEHPATASACKRWSAIAEKSYRAVPHNSETGSVTAADYKPFIDAETRVATIIHTSPVTGISVDVKSIVQTIRQISPSCIIIVDGIQHAPHGALSVDDLDIDAYAISAYKVYSRHNYGFAWVSPRLSRLPHDHLDGTADDFWELGTRDTSAFACFSEVVNYLDWLGSHFTESKERRQRIVAAGKLFQKQEAALVETMINGTDSQRGLRHIPGVNVLGGFDNDARKGLVSLYLDEIPCADVVKTLNDRGVRTHVRKNDYFSGNILEPLSRPSCVRVSMCHYNTTAEVLKFLEIMESIVS